MLNSVRKNLKDIGYTGYSLFEVLVVLGILAVFLSLATPSLMLWLTRLEQELVLERIQYAIEFAKNEAFRSQKTISLCPSADQRYCYVRDDWSLGFIVFENPERETQPAANCLLKFVGGARLGKIIYDAQGNELHIRPNGSTTNIGKFCYQPNNLFYSLPRKCVVINWATRTYTLRE